MATTFVKNGSNVLVTIGSDDPISIPGNAFIGPHPDEADAIIISDKFDPQNRLKGLKIFVSDVTVPTVSDRADLITQLSTDFFLNASTSLSVAGSGGGYLTYLIPADEIDGVQDTFTVPYTIDVTKSPLVIKDAFTYSLKEGIESITNTDGHAVIVMSSPIASGNIAYVLYIPPGSVSVTVTGSKEITDDYALIAADAEQDLYCNFSADKTITLPADADAAIAVNTRVNFRMSGTGNVIFVAGTDATMNSAEGYDRIAVQYGWASAIKTGADAWDLVGAITGIPV